MTLTLFFIRYNHDRLYVTETQRYLLITHRFYSNKKKDDTTCRKTEPIKEIDKSKLNPSDCKPRDLKPCKPPESVVCDRKVVLLYAYMVRIEIKY